MTATVDLLGQRKKKLKSESNHNLKLDAITEIDVYSSLFTTREVVLHLQPAHSLARRKNDHSSKKITNTSYGDFSLDQ